MPERVGSEMMRADLVNVKFVDDVIEDCPQIVQEVDHLHRRALWGESREWHDVREVDWSFLVQFRHHVRAELQAVSHRPAATAQSTK